MYRFNSLTPLLQRGLSVVFGCALILATSVSARAADIEIRNLEDLDFGAVPPTVGFLRARADFCVAMQPRGRYSLYGTGDGPNGEFSIIETGTGVHTIDYVVRVSDRGRRRGSVLRPGIPVSNLRASRQRRNGRCNPSARLRIVILDSELAAAHPGRYEGTLNLTVVPE